MSEKTILVLDYDGTLHDSTVEYIPAFRNVMKEIAELGWIEDREYTDEEICYWVGFSATEMWERFHPELSDEQRMKAGLRVGKYMLDDVKAGKGRLYDGVPEVLEELSRDYELMFFSNCAPEYIDVHKEAFGLDRWFTSFHCTGKYGFMQKEEVFSKYIYEPGRKYIAIGDRIKDMNLAAGCGMKSVGCLYGFGTEEELKSADALIHDIRELKAAVDKLNAQ